MGTVLRPRCWRRAGQRAVVRCREVPLLCRPVDHPGPCDRVLVTSPGCYRRGHGRGAPHVDSCTSSPNRHTRPHSVHAPAPAFAHCLVGHVALSPCRDAWLLEAAQGPVCDRHFHPQLPCRWTSALLFASEEASPAFGTRLLAIPPELIPPVTPPQVHPAQPFRCKNSWTGTCLVTAEHGAHRSAGAKALSPSPERVRVAVPPHGL